MNMLEGMGLVVVWRRNDWEWRPHRYKGNTTDPITDEETTAKNVPSLLYRFYRIATRAFVLMLRKIKTDWLVD
jgi:hypothetical protein